MTDDEVTIVELEKMKVMGMRRRGEYKIISEMLPALYEYAISKSIQVSGPAIFVCHESSKEEMEKAMAEKNADVECAIPVLSDDVTPGEGMSVYELPAAKMAKIVHKGPYEECETAYSKLMTWLGENGKKIVGPIREHYLNDPREVPPEEILTEIYAPID
jgi:effector-binding domain-containing protein